MTTCQDIRLRLSEFADGSMTPADRIAVDAHLSTCDDCRRVLDDLHHIRRAAATLGPITPPDHVWLQVAGQVRLERPSTIARAPRTLRRAATSQWIGLAAALVVITIGAHYFLRGVPDGGNAGGPPSVQRIADELTQAMLHYDNAITELEALTKSNGDVLDAGMAETLRQNIQTVNSAIDESRTALVQNPGSDTARESLFEALRRKVVVLQATVNLMNEMRKGNQSGAVAAAAVFGKS